MQHPYKVSKTYIFGTPSQWYATVFNVSTRMFFTPTSWKGGLSDIYVPVRRLRLCPVPRKGLKDAWLLTLTLSVASTAWENSRRLTREYHCWRGRAADVLLFPLTLNNRVDLLCAHVRRCTHVTHAYARARACTHVYVIALLTVFFSSSIDNCANDVGCSALFLQLPWMFLSIHYSFHARVFSSRTARLLNASIPLHRPVLSIFFVIQTAFPAMETKRPRLRVRG